MLRVCDDNHEPVTHNSYICPACRAIEETREDLDNYSRDVTHLGNQIQELQEELDRCVCRKLAGD